MNKIVLGVIAMMVVGCAATPVPVAIVPPVRNQSIDYLFANVGQEYSIDKADEGSAYEAEDPEIADVHVVNGEVMIRTLKPGIVDIATFVGDKIVHESIVDVHN